MIIKGRVLEAGKSIITSLLLGVTTTYATEFKMGDTAGFEVDTSETAPRGTIVYNGSSGDIAVTRIANDTVRFVCSVPEGAGPFYIGNCVLYMLDEYENSVPFIMVSFPYQVLKSQSEDQVTTDGFTLPGTRFAVSIELKHSDEETDVVVTVLPPDYSSLAAFANENDVPPGSSMTYKQFVVNYDSRTKTPVLVTVDDNNVRWAQPFSQQLLDPYFGQIDGGMDGEGYGGEADEIVFGAWYSSPDSVYTENPVGGASYTVEPPGVAGWAEYITTTNENNTQW